MRKRLLFAIGLALLFIGYYTLFDPSNGIVKDLPYGVELVLALNVVVLVGIGLVLADFGFSVWTDTDDDETEVIEKSFENKNHAMIYIGDSIRYLGLCILVGSVIYTVFK